MKPERLCPSCGQMRPNHARGVCSECYWNLPEVKARHKAYTKEYYKKNKEKWKSTPEKRVRNREKMRAYRASPETHEILKRRQREFYHRNKEACLAKMRAYKEKHRDELNAKQRAYNKKRREQLQKTEPIQPIPTEPIQPIPVSQPAPKPTPQPAVPKMVEPDIAERLSRLEHMLPQTKIQDETRRTEQNARLERLMKALRAFLILLVLFPLANAFTISGSINNTNPFPNTIIGWDFNITQDEALDYSFKIDGSVYDSGVMTCPTYPCSSTKHFEKFVGKEFGTVHEWKLAASDSIDTQTLNGTYSIQNVTLVLNAIPISNSGKFIASGRFYYESSTGVNNSLIEISSSLCGFMNMKTNDTGLFSFTCDYDDYAQSNTYAVNVTAYYDLETSFFATQTVQVNGLTNATITLISPTDLTGTQTFQTDSLWQVSAGSPVQKITIVTSFQNNSYTKECPFVTNNYYLSCEQNLSLFTPLLAGSYNLTSNFTWTDRQGTQSTEKRQNTITIKESASMVIQDLNWEQTVGTYAKANISLNASKSNVPIELEFPSSDYMKIDKVKVPAGETWYQIVNVTIPYSYTGMTIQGKLDVINVNTLAKYPFFYYITVKQPTMQFEELPETEVNEHTVIQIKLSNTGAPARNLTLATSCPQYWNCSVSPTNYETLNNEMLVKITLDPSLTLMNATTKILVTAKDAYDRSASYQIPIRVVLQSIVNASTAYVTDTVEYGVDYSQNVFFITDLGIVTKTDPTQDDAKERATVVSNVAPLVVSLDEKSEGIGNICDVWVRVNDVNYKLIPGGGSKLPLETSTGTKVLEYLVAKKDGVCKVKIDYNDQSTEAYIVFEGASQSTNPDVMPMTKKDGRDLVARVVQEHSDIREELLIVIGAFVVIIGGALFAIIGYPRLKHQIPEYQKQREAPPGLFFEKRLEPQAFQNEMMKPMSNPNPGKFGGRFFNRRNGKW